MIGYAISAAILVWFALFTVYVWVDLGDLIRQQAEDEARS